MARMCYKRKFSIRVVVQKPKRFMKIVTPHYAALCYVSAYGMPIESVIEY